jgi:hypothetical protein
MNFSKNIHERRKTTQSKIIVLFIEMSITILFRDRESTSYNPHNKPVNFSDKTSDYILVCPPKVCINVDNLFSYIQQEERANRISPTTDVVLIDRETIILTKTSSQKIANPYDLNIHNIRNSGTGIINVEPRLSKTHPQYKTMIVCDQSNRDQMIQDIEAAKNAEHTQFQRLRSLIYNLHQ